MRRLVVVAAAAIGAALVWTTAAVAEAAFRHGVGVHRPLNWADLVPGDRGRYAWPPFAGAEHEVSDALIDGIRAAGFDFVRLTVDPGPFLQMKGVRRGRLDALLGAQIRRFRARGLAVLVNFHSNSQVRAYRPELIFAEESAPPFKQYLAAVARTAAYLAAMRDPAVAFEPVNEPPYGYDSGTAARWQRMMEALYRAARAAAPELTIVVTGAQGGSRRGLALLDPRPFGAGNTLFSFHYYEPHLFTHQGTQASDGDARVWRYILDLPYPPQPDQRRATIGQAEARLAGDTGLSGQDRARLSAMMRSVIGSYFDAGWNAGSIGAAFDEVADWASGYGIGTDRILLGEFGATRVAGQGSATARAAWLRDVRCAAEQRRFAWSIWELNGPGGMAITDDLDRNGIDPMTRNALGLAAAPAADCRR